MTATKKSSTSSMRAAAVASSEEHYASSRKLETFQDLLIKLGIKPLMPVLEISMFSLNNVIMSDLPKFEQSQKKFGTFFVNLKIEFSKNFINISKFPNQILFTDFFFGKIQPMTLKLKILRSITRLFIIW